MKEEKIDFVVLGLDRPVNGLSRRKFLQTSALVTVGTIMAGPLIAAQPRRISPTEKLNIVAIGAGGKGSSDTDHCATENIVALCDADQSMAAGQLKKYPKAKFYQDFRKMYDEIGDSIDAVIVSTPDHMHAVAAARAIKMGKHVYCQKPLTQSVYEARTLRDLAKKHKVITQMGNQGSAEDGLRRAVEVIQGGVIGPVHEIHVWSNRPIWPQGIERPPGEDPVPSNLDWKIWLGPAPFRPYKKDVYHPFKWRGWLDFGTGALGDMACHTSNMPFRATKLGYPTSIEVLDAIGLTSETYPKTSKIKFAFPARQGLPPVDFYWYDGNPGDQSVKTLRPSPETTRFVREMQDTLPGSGCLLLGEKGQIFSPDDYGAHFYIKLNEDKEFKDGNNHEAVKAIAQSIPRNVFKGDTDWRHHQEWIKAIKDNNPALCYSNFDIAAYLTEIILLGCVAMRVGIGRKLEWDGPKMRAKNAPEAAQFVKRQYPKGWTL
jgi:hypothetical protein